MLLIINIIIDIKKSKINIYITLNIHIIKFSL